MKAKTRFTVDLTQDLNQILDELAEENGISKGEVFKRALGLYKYTSDSIKSGKKVGVADGEDKPLQTIFVL